MKRISSAIMVATVLTVACASAAEEKVPLHLTLPKPAFIGTKTEMAIDLKLIEPMIGENASPAPLMIAPGCVNLSAGLTPISSDTNATPVKLAKISDGDKEHYEESIVTLRKGVQHITFDLGRPSELHAIVVWHAHEVLKLFRSVVVQIADDAAFTKNVRTIFNNDTENQTGQGAGQDKQYFEQHFGKRIAANGEKAQFIRLWSRGSTQSALNEYTEVEVWGKPAK
jgi:hypothetical protein